MLPLRFSYPIWTINQYDSHLFRQLMIWKTIFLRKICSKTNIDSFTEFHHQLGEELEKKCSNVLFVEVYWLFNVEWLFFRRRKFFGFLLKKFFKRWNARRSQTNTSQNISEKLWRLKFSIRKMQHWNSRVVYNYNT